MYKINVETNRIEALNVKSFTELYLSERKHLQEWLAHAPEAFKEHLQEIKTKGMHAQSQALTDSTSGLHMTPEESP